MALPSAIFPAAIASAPGELLTTFDAGKLYNFSPAQLSIPGGYLNQWMVEIQSVENTLGINPQGSTASVVARLNVTQNTDGTLKSNIVLNTNVGSGAALANKVLTADGAGNTTWSTPTAASAVQYSAKSANYTAVAGDKGTVFDMTTTAAAAITLSLTAAATLGAGWYCWMRKADNTTGTIVASPTGGGDLIDGAASYTLGNGVAVQYELVMIVCTGTGFVTCGHGFGSPAVGTMLCGQGANIAPQMVALSGLFTVNATGVATGVANAVLNTMIGSGAAATGKVLTADGAGNSSWVASAPSLAYVTKSANYTAVLADKGTTFDVAGGAGGVTITLTAAATLLAGWFCYIRKSDSAAGTVTIARSGGDTIDGQASIVIGLQYEAVLVVCTGAGFATFGDNFGYGSSAQLLIAQGASTVPQLVTATGDWTITSAGVNTIGARKIVPTYLASDTVDAGVCEGRLTLTSVTPVTTADVTGATTIYFTPYKGNRIATFDGTNWNLNKFAEKNIALGTLADGTKPYDVFIVDGTLALEILVWASTTARATNLVLQDGVLCKSGALTRRYLGTFMPTSTTTTEDSAVNRYLWNYYNRVLRKMLATNSTANWTYTSATWRQFNGGTGGAGKINFVVGWSEVFVRAEAHGIGESNTLNAYVNVGVCLDNTNANNADITIGFAQPVAGAGSLAMVARYESQSMAVGQHFLCAVEQNQSGAGSASLIGTTAGQQVGIMGSIDA